jgi:hypothetical protein
LKRKHILPVLALSLFIIPVLAFPCLAYSGSIQQSSGGYVQGLVTSDSGSFGTAVGQTTPYAYTTTNGTNKRLPDSVRALNEDGSASEVVMGTAIPTTLVNTRVTVDVNTVLPGQNIPPNPGFIPISYLDAIYVWAKTPDAYIGLPYAYVDVYYFPTPEDFVNSWGYSVTVSIPLTSTPSRISDFVYPEIQERENLANALVTHVVIRPYDLPSGAITSSAFYFGSQYITNEWADSFEDSVSSWFKAQDIEDAYNLGFTRSISPSWFISGVDGFLNIRLFTWESGGDLYNFTIGTIFLIVIGGTALVWILKMFAGG